MANENSTLQTQDVEKQEVEVAEGTERTRPGRAYVPRADIYETEEALVLLADMPGVDQNTLDITLEKNVLSIRGLVETQNPDNYNLAYAEYEVGDYERNFTLSDGIDTDNISASLKNGVLQINLPKAGPAKARKINVSAA
ncbi:MAG: Hsp20/alpha crystallin family protein [Anaerolineae bacterium]|nr:Hsp20/alpha crystallin family protein [Anaerolineae bacterium]MCB0179207.1 Hsp20/alpha crystallin family protein [Anaerolineae bacterium]MCB0224084.1 Hsp20/alpha crystallin family protein [Anaerolineae bacterium]MCB9109052.1 Hsp20/alpha crystallin family protein [Anaerolineales bacterium]